MNKFSRALRYIDTNDVRERHLEKIAAREILKKKCIEEESKRIKEEKYIAIEFAKVKNDWRKEINILEELEKENQSTLFSRIISSLEEGMTTAGVFGAPLASAGETDLVIVQTGLTGAGVIDYGADIVSDPNQNQLSSAGNSTYVGDGEYTAMTAWEPISTTPDPTNVGTRFRAVDDFGGLQSVSLGHYRMRNIPGYKSDDIGRGFVVSGGGAVDSGKFDNRYKYTIDTLGLSHPQWSNTEGLIDQGYGTTTVFKNGISWAAMRPVDTSEVDTIKFHAQIAGNYITNPAYQVQLYYWAGDKPGFQSLASDIYDGEESKPHDGWRPLYQKPDGTIDTSVNHIIIPTADKRPAENAGVLSAYTQHIPQWCRSKATRFIIFSPGANFNAFNLTSVRFQRKNQIMIGTPLDSPEASSFVRVGQGSAATSPEQRRKKVEDMLKASRLYLMKILGYTDFPGMGATLSKVAASPTSFSDIWNIHAASLPSSERSEFRRAVSDRSRQFANKELQAKAAKRSTKRKTPKGPKITYLNNKIGDPVNQRVKVPKR